MVSIGSSTRPPRPSRTSFALLQWASQAAYILILFLCFLLLLTLLEIDAPDNHGDLAALHQEIVSQNKVKTKGKYGPSNVKSTEKHANVSKEAAVKDSKPKNAASIAQNTTKIGYVVTITDCGRSKDIPFPITEGAAVLKHSIHKASSRYGYQMYAIYHPNAQHCVESLRDLGYTLIQRDTPVAVNEIQGDFLRERIVNNGCCGEKELIKLEAFTMTQHPVIVLLDLDALILKPLDPLFDLILHGTVPPSDHLQWHDRPIPNEISLLYTIDYAMVNPERRIKPVQGGFLVLKPDKKVYEEFRSIVRKGDYRDHGGWEGKSGKFWGSMTVQGLIPYYYIMLHPGRAVELNRCIYNNMCSNAREGKNGTCFTQEESCEDCRLRPLKEIASTHFTICQKPWLCWRHARNATNHNLCRMLHHEWFRIRSDMEQSWGRPGWGTGKWVDRDQFFGYCNDFGEKGYGLIQKPYGMPIKS